jgi:hypothetical protein
MTRRTEAQEIAAHVIRIPIQVMDLRGLRFGLEIDAPAGASDVLKDKTRRKDYRLGRAAVIRGPGAEGRRPAES